MYCKKILPLIITLLAISFLVNAQVTTSSISGTVKNKSGSTLPGATITATHTPTGTVYTAVSRTEGRFDISNMNPGGPYIIAVSFVGYETNTKEDVYLALGETQRIEFEVADKTTELTTVTVAGRKAGSNRNGTETSIGRDKIALLPTIGRNLNDFVRFTPQTKITSNGGISIGGQNNRYNSFMIDGAVNNDVFGLSEQGTNGGRAGTPPISIDAIDQIAVQISPYDASFGNFTGGGINAITKSGTNNFHGSAYYIFRNQDLSGKTPGVVDSLRKKLTDFKNQTYGFTLGGPIVKNKAFFFINVEQQKDNRPQPFAGPNTPTSFNVADTIAKLVNHLKTTYNYDPGDWINNADEIDRTNINTRFDFNVNRNNKLTLSYRYTKAERLNPSRSNYNGSSGSINFTNGGEYFPSTTHSGNVELNTKFNNNANNKFRVSFTDVVDDRDATGSPFPAVTLNPYAGGPTINFGSEAASSANILKQRIINFYDAFKLFVNNHAFTFGADVDVNKSYNLFMNRNFGLYTYSALGPNGPDQINPLTAFMQNLGPSRYRRGYSLVDPGNKGGDANTKSAANFNSLRLGFFVNDDIKFTDKLTVTVGLRADKTSFLTDVPLDPFFRDSAAPVITKVYDLEGAQSGQKFTPSWQFSPRVGFRYNMDDENLTVRGGFGVFGGRTPLVWPGGLYQNAGNLIGAVDESKSNNALLAPGNTTGLNLNGEPLDFRGDVNNQYTQADFGLPANLLTPQGDLNIISKNFKLPAVFKVSAGIDKRLNKGWTITFDALYTKNIHEVDWANVNFLPPTATPVSGPDKRLIYSTSGNPSKLVYRPWSNVAAVRNPYSNIILIRNISGQRGFSYNFTASVDKQSRNGLGFNVSYSYGNSMVHNEGTSSVNTSNWQNMEVVSNRNALQLTTSDFDMGHRVFALISKKFTYAKGRAATTIALTYNGQSGNPFSYTMNGFSFTGDAVTFNDLMYVPKDRAEMDQMLFIANGNLTPTQQKDQFEEFIQSDKYLRKRRGKYAERNGARLPFTNIVDMSVNQDFTVKAGGTNHTLSVRFDIFNLTNLIDKDAGRQYFLNFDQAQVIDFRGFANGVPQYRFNKPVNNKVGSISDGVNAFNSSRWNGQVTVRYSF